MKPNFSKNCLWASLIIEEMVRCGVRFFVLSPGARSAPLAKAVAEHPNVTSTVHFDERGAAYYALGYAKASRKPAALICTSGTATANYFPAIIEASYACVPLLVITADRPPELTDSGANQTIRQTDLYGNHVRWATTLPCPTDDIAPENILPIIDQAVHHALGQQPGPVHINSPFREPLIFDAKKHKPSISPKLETWKKSTQPYTTWHSPSLSKKPSLSTQTAKSLLQQVNADMPGCIIASETTGASDDTQAILALAQHLNWHVLPDITSGLRLGATHPQTLPYYDLMLDRDDAPYLIPHQTVIHFGGQITSKRLLTFLKNASPKTYVHIDPYARRSDPFSLATHQLNISPADFYEWIKDNTKPWKPANHNTRHQEKQQQAALHLTQAIAAALDACLPNDDTLTEPTVCRTISAMIPHNHALFLGNSLPIREMDTFGTHAGAPAKVYANRGASGIDGNIATTAGILASGCSGLTAIIGDLAFLHDINSLHLLTKTQTPTVLVILNNDGGGIFQFLEVKNLTPIFDRYFVVPHGYTFQHAADLFKIPYEYPQTQHEFLHAYLRAVQSPHTTILEIKTDPIKNTQLHNHIRNIIRNQKAGS